MPTRIAIAAAIIFAPLIAAAQSAPASSQYREVVLCSRDDPTLCVTTRIAEPSKAAVAGAAPHKAKHSGARMPDSDE